MTSLDHTQATELFSSYLDRELEAERRRALEEHLEGCEACRAEYQVFERSVGGAHRLPRVTAPPDLVEGVIDRVRRRSAGRFFGERRLGDRIPLELFSLLMLGIILAIYLFLHVSEPGHVHVP